MRHTNNVMTTKLTIKDFEARYPDEDTCLDDIFKRRYGHFNQCPDCLKPFAFYRVRGRKCYACQYCSYQIHPLSGTIFHKSETPLKLWFFAIFLFSASKNGVAAKELERQLGVTYKTAWRMAKMIRTLFEDDEDELLGDMVEVDETYVGGKAKGTRGRGADGKTPVVGIAERDGGIKAFVTGNVKSSTVMPLITKSVKRGSSVFTDEFGIYNRVAANGYHHERVNHGRKEYVRGIAHTNTIEGFWSQLKRSINGTYHAVSPKYLQSYVNEFAYRYNNRGSRTPIFEMVLERVERLSLMPC
jgi:transposase